MAGAVLLVTLDANLKGKLHALLDGPMDPLLSICFFVFCCQINRAPAKKKEVSIHRENPRNALLQKQTPSTKLQTFCFKHDFMDLCLLQRAAEHQILSCQHMVNCGSPADSVKCSGGLVER